MHDIPAATGERQIRVVMLIDRLVNPSGAERFAIGLAAELRRLGFDVSICATREASDEVSKALSEAGIPLEVLGRRSTIDLLPFVRLIRSLRRRRVDVLHGHMLGSSVWAGVVGRIAGVPVVIAHEHGTLLTSWRHRLAYGTVVGRLATRYVAVSSRVRDRLVSDFGVPRSKTEVIPAAYVPRPDDGRDGLRDALGIPASAVVLGTVATLRPVKALDVLLDAHARVLDTHDDTHVVLVGDGPSRRDLELQAERLGTADKVHFPGFREDVGAVLRAIDIGVLSSDSEGTPLFVLECMAHRVPVVSTDVGGLRDIVEDGVSALLVPAQSPAELAAAVGELVDRPDERRRLAEAASSRIPELSVDAIAERFAALYRSELSRSRRRRLRAPFRR